MNTNYLPFLILWGLMALSVLAPILWRKSVASGEDDSLHVLNDAQTAVPHQVALAHKLDVIDRWGKTLTVVTVLYGLALAAVYFYRLWVTTSTTIQS
jgi:hypothetical protein